jgi:hypothetical protein
MDLVQMDLKIQLNNHRLIQSKFLKTSGVLFALEFLTFSNVIL